MSKGFILFRTLLKSTSLINIYRHTNDKKKKRRTIAGFIGLACLYAMLIGYSFAMCIGYGKFGMIDSAPVLCAITISAIAFVFTFFKTNGYLFGFKEYDMLMSLPFKASTVAGCKFLYMYVKNLAWYMCISLPIMVGYGYYAHPSAIIYPVWIILSFFIPIIPMLLASFLGFLIARISAGFRKTNIMQTILSFIFVILCFSLRFIIEDLFRDDKVEATLESIAVKTDAIGKIFPPAGWFAESIVDERISSMLLLVGVSILLFAIVFKLVGDSYRNINSAIKSHAAGKSYKMTAQKKHSIVTAIAFKELKRMTGSTVFMVNGAMGEVLSVILGVVTLVIGFDRIVATVVNGAPVDPKIIQPAIPFIVYFLLGMVATTACTPSLEGKNYWIIQSLPIEKKQLYQGKMLFNICLTIPFMIFATLCLCISAKVPLLDTLLYLILGSVLCAFSTTWGCVCGIKHMRLDWENEVEVIKQGAAVALYMFPNMFVVMGLIVGVVVLSLKMDHMLVTLVMTLIAALFALINYLRVMSLAKKE